MRINDDRTRVREAAICNRLEENGNEIRFAGTGRTDDGAMPTNKPSNTDVGRIPDAAAIRPTEMVPFFPFAQPR